MITLTKLPECTGLYIQSELLNTWVTTYPNNEDVTVSITYNCVSTYTTEVLTLDTEYFSVPQRRIELVPEMFGWEDKLRDGIYFIAIEQTNDNGSVSTETECLFVDCHTKCDVFSYLAAYPNDTSIAFLHGALSYMSDCSDCKCEDGCTIFNHILAKLNDPSVKLTDCGCNKS